MRGVKGEKTKRKGQREGATRGKAKVERTKGGDKGQRLKGRVPGRSWRDGNKVICFH